MQKLILFYALFINVVAFILYAYDKYRARRGARRVSEKTLHLVAIYGGFIGATLSMILFRHKVKKSSFLLWHIAIVVLWVGGLLFYFGELNALNFLR